MIAISLITGFLGSGKTTLLNRLLAHPDMARTAVLINEFGAVGIDHLTVKRLDEGVVLLKSGCICCTVQGQLVDGLKELYMRRLAGELPAFTRVVIETTGLADPLPIVACIRADPLFKHVYALDALITTVDAEYGAGQLEQHEEARRQVAVADRLVLTKIDRAHPDFITSIERRLAALNPGAPLIKASFGQVAPGELFGAGWFEPNKFAVVGRWLNDAAYSRAAGHAGHSHASGASRHDEQIRSFVIAIERPIPWAVFRDWYDELAQKRGGALLRVKGIVSIAGESRPYLIHCVQATQYEPTPLEQWPDGDRRSRIVFITLDLDREAIATDLELRLEAAAAPGSASAEAIVAASRADNAGRVRWLDKGELSRVFAALLDEQDRIAADVIRMMLLTGVALPQICALRREDIDLARSVMTLPPGAKARGPVRPKPRHVPLGEPAKALVTARFEQCAGSDALFAANGSAIAGDRVQRAWAAVAERAALGAVDLDRLAPVNAADLFDGLPRRLQHALLGLAGGRGG